MALELTLNPSRPILRRSGWEMFQTAAAFAQTGATRTVIGAPLVPGPVGFDPATGVASTNAVWLEPNKKVAMLIPGPLRSDFTSDPVKWEQDWFKLEPNTRFNRLDVVAGAIEIATDDAFPGTFTISRDDADTPLTGLAPDTHLSALDIESEFGLVWLAKSTRPLQANEGFSFWFAAPGAIGDAPGSLCGIAFGTSWFLSIHGGFAWLMRRQIIGGESHWVKKVRLNIQEAKFEPGGLLQVTVLPWGPDYISILFSATKNTGGESGETATQETRRGFLIEMRKLGLETQFSPSLNQNIKTEPAKLHLAFPRVAQNVHFLLAAVRFKPAGMRFAPQLLPEPKPHASPVPALYGIFGQKDASGQPARFYKNNAFTIPGVGHENDLGAAWNPATDTRLAMYTYLKPSGNEIHSPEVWGLTAKIDPLIETMADTAEEEVSPDWRRLSFDLTLEPQATFCEVLLSRQVAEGTNLHDHFKRLLTTGGFLRVVAKGEGNEGADVTLFEGIITDRRPVVRGSLQIRTDGVDEEAVHRPLLDLDMLARSLWDELDRTPAQGMVSLARRTIGAILREGFARAGFPPEKYSIAAELDSLMIDGADEGGDDIKLPNDDTSVGELFRSLGQNYGRQGQRRLLIMPKDGVFECRFETYYDPDGQIDWAFILGSEIETPAADDETRWGLGELRVLDDQLEISCYLPQYNSLSAHSSPTTGETFAVHIAPDPRVFDPESPEHHVRVSGRFETPSQTAFASTLNGLARYARKVYEEECMFRPRTTLVAEWQPGVWPDQIVTILGQALADDPDRAIAIGDKVSYGCWKIERISVDLYMDETEASLEEGALTISGDRRFTRTATYSLEWCGASEIDGVPMWAPEEFWP